ncbi:hypothetical protein ABIA00_004361 [Bradyrhizobium ottawaense]|uniref:NACHT domain-containing protein n=1 Tax=Bradyrhizobium ottawaense TaxID=931866 RepID=UPI0038395D5F
MDIDVPGILMDIGISNATPVQRAPHLIRCELWVGEEDSITAKKPQLRVLVLHSGFAEEHLTGARQKLMSLGAGSVHIVLFEDSLPDFDFANKVQLLFRDARCLTIGAALRQAVFRAQTIDEPAPVDYYVAPTIVPADGAPLKESAVSTLVAWIRGSDLSSDAPSRIGILLAPAGSGKTALSIELFKNCLNHHRTDLRSRRTSEWPFPLLIDRFAWINQDFREGSDSLADLVSNAIFRQFRFQPPIDRIQRCLRYGAICPILDGFDELCATNPFMFGADDTIAGLVDALEGVRGSRILLTCRESFWHDNVDIKLQSQVTAFRLSPFSEAQRREYLAKRFPADADKAKRDRTLTLLQKISSIRDAKATAKSADELVNLSYLPWVVQFAAEATDTNVLSNTVFESTSATPDIDPVGHVLWQFCRREQQRIGISLSPEGQIRFFASLAAISDEWFPVDQVNLIHELLLGEADYPGEGAHVEFLRKHGFLHIAGTATPNNCRFEYPEIQDYLRARLAVDSICGSVTTLGEDEVFARCATEQTRLVDFISLLLRWKLSEEQIISAIASLRARRSAEATKSNATILAGLLQIVLRVLRDQNATSQDVAKNLCKYFGDDHGHNIDNASFSGLISRLDLSGIWITNSRFEDAYLEHVTFDAKTVFESCDFEGEFGAAMNCKQLGDVTFSNCKFSPAALATFRQHKNKIGRVRIDRSHIEDACHRILRQFHIGQMGLRSKAYDDIRHEASKASTIGDEILQELIRSEVLAESKGGTRHSLEVKDRGAVSAFIQQSTPRGAMARAIDKIVSGHSK